MEIFTEVLGNLHDPAWAERAGRQGVETLELDQWTAQKSRFVTRSDRDAEYAVALARHVRLLDGDVVACPADGGPLVAVRIRLNDVMAVDLGGLLGEAPERMLRTAVELGHALGNQHWPAVVKGRQVYVPLTVDRKVMESVMRTHRLERVTWRFQPGSEVIPYLAPHEVRRLFGGAEPAGEPHHHHHHHHPETAPAE